MHPLIDIDAGGRAMCLADRPLVALSAGLADAIRQCATAGRALTLVTPDSTRLTFPLRLLAMSDAVDWAVRSAAGDFFDGLTGVRLDPAGGAVVGTPDGSDPVGHARWLERAGGADSVLASQLLCTVAVQHRAAARLRLDATELLCRALTGTAPLGWGTGEPVAQRWDVAAATAFARRRAPQPTRLVVTGLGFIATVEVTRTDIGVQEDVTALFAAGADDEPTRQHAAEAVREAFARMAAQRTVGFAVAQHRRGRLDLTTPAHFESPPTPTALLIGPRACRQLGLGFLESSPLPGARRVGHERLPGLLWGIDGSFDEAWAKIGAFVAHLGPQRLAESMPGLLL